MMLSNDNDPYITNLSYGFSHLQYPSIKYGYFPTTFKNIMPRLIISNNDLKLPIGKNKTDYYVIKQLRNNSPFIDTDNLDKFNQLTRNYCSSWYNEWKQSYESIDDIVNDNIWTDVRYNYAYLNGILYNFNNILQNNNSYVIYKISFISYHIITYNLVKKEDISVDRQIYSLKEIIDAF